ncbi:MAG TPA: APC family permease [Thermoanaerobaculia bacterium]|nr:APC family permease [Thermoanaerobaculia bacterium]
MGTMSEEQDGEVAAELRREEARVEARSGVFRKELGLTDLALTQVLFIVGLPWIGVAAKQGPSHVVLWLLAMVFFYLPSAVVVTYLNRIMPLEGGLYQWAKLGGSELLGFLVAWNLWLFAILNTSEIGLQVTQYLRYILGPDGEGLTASKPFIAAVSLLIVVALALVTTVGLSVGKWVHKAGGALMLLTFAAIVVLPWLNRARGSLAEYHPLRIETPVLSLMTLNLLGKMGFGALGGFEYVAIHSGECRDPVRSLTRSVALAAPVIAAMFILGTSSVLALVPQARIDLIAPIPQVLAEGSRALPFAAAVAPLAILALLAIRMAQSSVMFAGNTRLPMVAGWDRLLPEWFTRLHARYRTPVNSILFVAAATLVLGLVGLIGVGKQEAFQLLWNASGVFYALTYVAMFVLPLFGLRGVRPRPPLWLKICALSGLLMTLLYLALSIVPIIEVQSRLSFALKISGLIALTNAIGLAIYLAARRRR